MSNAQTESTDRHFQKDYCTSEINLLSDQRYSNGEELSYDTSGCPIVTQTIHRWNELSDVDKTLITNRMSVNGYTDITPVAEIIRGNN